MSPIKVNRRGPTTDHCQGFRPIASIEKPCVKEYFVDPENLISSQTIFFPGKLPKPIENVCISVEDRSKYDSTQSTPQKTTLWKRAPSKNRHTSLYDPKLRLRKEASWKTDWRLQVKPENPVTSTSKLVTKWCIERVEMPVKAFRHFFWGSSNKSTSLWLPMECQVYSPPFLLG